MNSEIEIKKIDHQYTTCVCCKNNSLDRYKLSFMHIEKYGTQGTTVTLCEDCIKIFKEKLNNFEVSK